MPPTPDPAPPRAPSGRAADAVHWIWLGPLAFLVHDAEEVATVEGWLRAHRAALPDAVRPLAEEVTTAQFAIGVAVLFAGFALAAWHGARAVRRGRLPLPFLLAAGAFVANGATHLVQALWFRGYTPGVATAALVVLPYGYALMRTLPRAGVVSAAGLRRAIIAGAALQVPLALLALAAGR